MPRNRNPQRRLGALLSIEALFVLVIAFVLVLALIEFGFLMSARERGTQCQSRSNPRCRTWWVSRINTSCGQSSVRAETRQLCPNLH